MDENDEKNGSWVIRTVAFWVTDVWEKVGTGDSQYTQTPGANTTLVSI